MQNIGVFLLIFVVILFLVAVLAIAIGYFWASSRTKSASLDQQKDQINAVYKQARDQLQNWKDQELASTKLQIYDDAKGQAVQEIQEQVRKWQETELIKLRQQMLDGVRGEAIKEAQAQLMKWRTDELEKAKSQIWEVLSKQATVNLEQWKVEAEKEIRKDAIDKSQSVTMGKMTEHMVPYLPGFGFNPTDARFIGSPIDLVVFDGLSDGDVKRIVFVEIKTGVSTLSTRERVVRDAVLAKNVEWMEVKANMEGPEVVVSKVKARKNSG